ncbi:uncharacterized protein LOC124690662 [Lolium rigidum]|uniref:uncharacterized protein LOC124690662 n=1 Tax=Lolium rigidum TaxID=89674 RepID=UPI001F5DB895|nr:uncharacterized protein LOC124690662 [Lolium rigidum]
MVLEWTRRGLRAAQGLLELVTAAAGRSFCFSAGSLMARHVPSRPPPAGTLLSLIRRRRGTQPPGLQAKTTKNIVLKLQCQSCKHCSQRAIKALSARIFAVMNVLCYEKDIRGVENFQER